MNRKTFIQRLLGGGAALLLSPPIVTQEETVEAVIPEIIEESSCLGAGIKPITVAPCNPGGAGIKNLYIARMDDVRISEISGSTGATADSERVVNLTWESGSKPFFEFEFEDERSTDLIREEKNIFPEGGGYAQTVSITLPGDDESRREALKALEARSDDIIAIGPDKEGNPTLLAFDSKDRRAKAAFLEVFGIPYELFVS